MINYDLPNNRELYIHRIGRSGRFGRKVPFSFPIVYFEYTQLCYMWEVDYAKIARLTIKLS